MAAPDNGIEGIPDYLRLITRTHLAYYDQNDRKWYSHANNYGNRVPVPAPTLEELRAYAADGALTALQAVVPELSSLLGNMREHTLTTFANGILDRVQAKLPDVLVERGRDLVNAIVDAKTKEAQGGSSFGWSIETRVKELVDAYIQHLVSEQIEKALRKKPDLIEKIVAEALKEKALHTHVNNLVTPRLMELVEDLRLELTAGKPSSRY